MEYKVIKQLSFSAINRNKWYTYQLVNEDGGILSSVCVENEEPMYKFRYVREFKDKKIAYIFNFETSNGNRKKGYGRYLLKDVIRRFKGKYDIIHLNACPYYLKDNDVIYESPKDGLNKQKLIKFYESLGFESYKTLVNGWEIMLLK